MRKRCLGLAFFYLAFSIFLASVSTLCAQYLVALPGATSSDPTVSVYETSNFSDLTSLSVPGAFKLLNLPNGVKHYFVSSKPGVGLVEVNSTFSKPRLVGNFPGGLSAGALSPDGSRLIVATAPISGSTPLVYIFDTSYSEDSLTPQGLSVVTGVAVNVVDIAVSYDSKTAFVLGNIGQGQSFLSAIDLQKNKVTTTLNMSQQANGIAIGPNGLLYVSALAKILEVDPSTLTVTSAGSIAVQASPGKLVFTPNGRFGVGANLLLSSGAGVVLLDLTTHGVSYAPSTGLSAPFDKLMPASSSVIYAWSSVAQSLSTLQISNTGGITINAPAVTGVTLSSSVTAAGLSNDLGVPGRSYPQFLFVVSGGILYRIDPASSTLSQQVGLSSSPADLNFWTPTATGNTPVSVLTYGNNQAIPPGGTSLPLVARFLDANGLPLSGVPVDFSVSSGTVNPTYGATGEDGFVQTIFTAGTAASDVGSFTLKVGNSPAAFTVNVVTSSTTTTPGQPQLSIVSGQGQIVLANPTSGAVLTPIAPFTTLVTDATGAPVANVPVTFTWTSGRGFGQGQPSVVVPTNSAGIAALNFMPPPIFAPPNSYISDTFTASVPGLKSVNFYITGMAGQAATGLPFTAYLRHPSPGSVLKGIDGSTLSDAIEVVVLTSAGIPIPNVGLQVYTGTNPTASIASCANPAGGPVALTDAHGLADCNLALNGVPGTLPLTISVGGLLNFPGETLTVEPGPPSSISIVSGNNQYGALGKTLTIPFEVLVTDALKNPLVGAPLNWQVVSGSMALTGANAATNSRGMAYAAGTPTGTGIISVRVTSGSASATFTVLATVPPAVVKIISGQAQSAPVNMPFGAPLVVQVSDAAGNPSPLSTVNFTVTGGPAAVSSSSVVADIHGVAAVTAQAGPVSGPVTVVATAGSARATFPLTVLPLGPSNISIVNAASLNPGIAPGALVIIEGNGLTPTIQGSITAPSQMAGYSVTFGSTPAPVLTLVNQNGMQQIGIQVPFEVTLGANNVIIQTPQGSLTLPGVVVNPVAPGMFTSGTPLTPSPAAFALRPDGSVVSPTNPAHPGENITLFATGIGLTLPLPSTNVPGFGQVLADTIYAGVNHIGVEVVSAVYQSGQLGVYAITIQIPLTVAPGMSQPVSIVVVDPAGTYPAPTVFLPIQ